MATRREKEKKKLRYASSKAIAEKQQRGFDLTSFSLPKGVKLFQFKEEKVYRLVILPFEAKRNPNCDKGEFTWERTYFAHSGVGPDNKKYTCSFLEKNEKCPIHDEAARLRRNGGDNDLIYNIEKTGKRQLIAVFDLENKGDGVQIYEGPYYNGFGEVVDNKIDATDDDSDYRNFFHCDSLMKISVKCKKEGFQTKEGKGGSFFKPVNVEMDRLKDGIVTDEILESVPCLDDCVKMLDYADLKKIFLQVSGDNEDEDRPQKGNKSITKSDEEEEDESDTEENEEESGDDETSDRNGEDNPARKKGIKVGTFVSYDGDECEVKKISPSGTLLSLETEDGELYSKVEITKVTKVSVKDDEEEEEEEEKPHKKAAKPKNRIREEEEEEEEEEDKVAMKKVPVKDDEEDDESDLEEEEEDDD